jgi:hypothetical protein
MATEEPKFTLALKDGPFELRDYAATVVAEVTVTGDQQEAGRKGFGLLAGYIFGGNRARQKIAMTTPVTKIAKGQMIAMTAPVQQTSIAPADAANTEWLVRFTLPSQYALTDLPLPNDPAVRILPMPPGRFAVLGFSGLAGEAAVADATAELRAQLAARGLVATGPAVIARYNPPWTPWFLRRNEVMVPVNPA